MIDRAIFFDNPEIEKGKLSPNGQYVSFMKEHKGIMNIWVKAFDEDFKEAKPLTTYSSPLFDYYWTDDSKYILYEKDNNGDENLNVFAVNPYEEVEDGTVPESKNLTPLEAVQVHVYGVSKIDPDRLMLGINDRDKAWHDLYSLKISTGELIKILENNNRYTNYIFDWDELDNGNFEEVYTTNSKEQASVVGFTKDNTKCYLVSNKGDADLNTLYTMDLKTSEIEKIESDPEGKVDFDNLFFNRHTREIIATSYNYDKIKRYFKNKKWEEDFAYLSKQFPDREVDYASFTKDYSKMLIATYGDKYATEVYFFNPAEKELILQYTRRPRLKTVEDQLSNMQSIFYKSSDGLKIPAYLSLPKDKEMARCNF